MGNKKQTEREKEEDEFVVIEARLTFWQVLHLITVADRADELSALDPIEVMESDRTSLEAVYPITAAANLLTETLEMLLQQRQLVDWKFIQRDARTDLLTVTPKGMRLALWLLRRMEQCGFSHREFLEGAYERFVDPQRAALREAARIKRETAQARQRERQAASDQQGQAARSPPSQTSPT